MTAAPVFRVLRQSALAALLVAFLHVCAFAQGAAPPPAAPAAATPASAPPVVAAAAEIVSRAEVYLQAQARVNLFNGTVLVARDGAPILVKGYGMADAEWQVPNTAQTKFRLGSITKQFTATVVLRLQEQKKLSVQDAICMYLTSCPDSWKPVTIQHLLTHTSGIPSYTGLPDFAKTMMVPKTTEQVVASFRDLPLDFATGEKFKYNNSGYFLLGLIIEKVTGKKYDEVVSSEIFTPLAMADSGYDWTDTVLPRRASGYVNAGSRLVNAKPMDMQQPYAAGSLYSTVEDLLKWDQALYTDRVLPAAAREAMFTPFKDNYAYGWTVQPPERSASGKTQVGHGGGINGFATMIARVPEDKVVVIVLGNVENVSAGNIARDVMSIVYGRPYQTPVERTAIPVKPELLAEYVGRYQIGPNFVLAVTLEDGRLMTQATGQNKLEVFAESETKFFLKAVDAQLTFGRDEAGKVSHVTLHQNGQDRRAQKVE